MTKTLFEKPFLVQRLTWEFDKDGNRIETRMDSVMSEDELIHYIDMSDCFDEQYVIYDLTHFDSPRRLHYKGWQPHCLIEVVDENNEVVVSGHGTDH